MFQKFDPDKKSHTLGHRTNPVEIFMGYEATAVLVHVSVFAASHFRVRYKVAAVLAS